MFNIEELNTIQKQAVLDTEGAVLVTAGAGSGKTRLLTYRIAHIINDLNVPPYNVLAITFTNKAAQEMRERLENLINVDGIWIFTFHAACVRILRRFIDRIGFSQSFTIYGEPETKSVVKRFCKKKGLQEDSVKLYLSAISKAKNSGIAPDDYAHVMRFNPDAEDIAEAYNDYQSALKKNNALDYDDLLIKTLELLETCEEAREFYQNKFRYIHIDEFQDTNIIQYKIAMILAQKHKNIFAVGDEDQCIYTWRGASIRNIFDFQKDFKCKVYKLEQNYRSTSNILDIANRIIKTNSQRLDKNLWTDNGKGAAVECYAAQTEGFEADYVVRTIYKIVSEQNYNFRDCAVLMRLNALTRSLEERFLQYGIPHKVYGGFKFYDRKEVRDVLAYARIAVNHNDDEACCRIINFPRRMIGETSVDKIRTYAEQSGKSIYDIVTDAENTPFNSALKLKLTGFGEVLRDLSDYAKYDATRFFRHLLFEVLNVVDLFSEDTEETMRLENLNELLNSVREFVKTNPEAGVGEYLQMVSLYSDTDNINDDNAVTIATVHSAKGLEFPNVFIIGAEESIFPSLRAEDIGDSSRLEEERRLMYVAITRAREHLYITYAKSRFMYGNTKYNPPSRFLAEAGLVDKTKCQQSEYSNGGFARASDRVIESDSARTALGLSAEKNNYTYKSDFAKSQPKATQDKSIGALIHEGVLVNHKRLGRGTVIGTEKMGDNLYAKIEFATGVMLLAVDFAPITLVEKE